MTINHFSNNLKFLRKKTAINQADIAKLVTKRPTAISSWENGLSQPSFEDLIKISDYFGISAGDLLTIDLQNGGITPNAVKPKKGGMKGGIEGGIVPMNVPNDVPTVSEYGANRSKIDTETANCANCAANEVLLQEKDKIIFALEGQITALEGQATALNLALQAVQQLADITHNKSKSSPVEHRKAS